MKKSTILNLLQYIAPHRLLLVVLIIVASISSIASLLVPILIGVSIDTLITGQAVSYSLLVEKLSMLFTVVAIGAISQWLLARVTNKLTYRIARDMRDQTYQKLHTLPLKYIDQTMHGNIVSRVTNDIEVVSQGLLQSFTSLFTGVMTIVGTIAILCYIQFSIACIVIVLTPLSLFVAGFIVKRTHRYFQTQLAIRGKMTGYVNEMITNIDTVIMHGYSEGDIEEYELLNQEMHKSGVISQFYGAVINPTTRYINSFVYNAVGIFGAIAVLQGTFSVGMLSSFLTYANQYTKPFNEISAVMSEMQLALTAFERVYELMQETQEQPKEDLEQKEHTGNISLEEVSFSYQEGNPFIEGLSIDVEAGQTIAIVGKTGCGKTTLINLLMDFYDIQSGNIIMNNMDTRDLSRDTIRSCFGMVLQDSWIFKGTVKENIAYGKQDASDQEIIDAANSARVHKFIMSLPNGYETMLEEDGGNLSKGQKQLLCIARVMLVNPPMLILDEATSSIDTRTEVQIQQAIDTMMKGKTAFIVAHRLSTIRNADSILVMDQGKIIEQGNHHVLLQKDGYYAKLYHSQFSN